MPLVPFPVWGKRFVGTLLVKMKTLLALLGLAVIGIFALLWYRQRSCQNVMTVDAYGRASYVRPGQIQQFVCGDIGPPIRPNTAETDPKYAQPSQSKRLCATIVGGGSAIAATSSNPYVQAAGAYFAFNGPDTCSGVSESVSEVQELWKGIKSLF